MKYVRSINRPQRRKNPDSSIWVWPIIVLAVLVILNFVGVYLIRMSGWSLEQQMAGILLLSMGIGGLGIVLTILLYGIQQISDVGIVTLVIASVGLICIDLTIRYAMFINAS